MNVESVTAVLIEAITDRLIVPTNPLRLRMEIMELLATPLGAISDEGKAVTEKSGGGVDETMVKMRVTVCDRFPRVPVTLTSHTAGGVDNVVKNVSLEEFIPPAWRTTFDGLMFQPGQFTHRGCGDVASATVPVSPFTLVRLTLATASEPDLTEKLLGTAPMVKSGVDVWTTVAP